MIRLTIGQVLSMHTAMTSRTGGDSGLRDEGLLSSALESVWQTFGGEELYPTIEEKGARLCYSLVSNHAFVDGNKRIGVYVMLVFLRINGVDIHPSIDDVISLGLGVASGEMNYDDTLAWTRSNIK